MGGQLHPTTREMRFWAQTDKEGPPPSFRPELGNCWLWTGRQTEGYGRMLRAGKKLSVHRYAYELLVGPIPDGLEIDHLCRTTLCVRGSHLEPVTHQENMRRGMRGILKTHCIRGHALIGTNVRHYKGQRYCRSCKRDADQIRRKVAS